MTIQEIYDLAIQMGIKADPRGQEGVKKALKRRQKEYQELPEKKKKYYDQESLKNPYADSRILFGDSSVNVDKILTGIDIGSAELILADRLNEKGEGIDLVIAHHPAGVSLAGLYDVMDLQIDIYAQYGVPVNVAEGLMGERIGEVQRGLAPANHGQSVDAARILGIPLMNLHTPTDNLVHQFLEKKMKKAKPELVEDVLEVLNQIPEYQEAKRYKAGPTLFAGKEKNRAGKVAATALTGGTSGSKKIYERLVQAGVGTVIAMHAKEEHVKQAKEHHINLVIAGHISSDSLGMNLFLDELEKKNIHIIPCSGLIRVSRVK